MPKAFIIIFSAGVLILLYPLLHEKSAFLSENFRSYSLTDRFFDSNLIIFQDTICTDSSLTGNIQEDFSLEPKYSGTEHLSVFFEKLRHNNTQIRIAYYGDSAIEGDLISQTVRDSLQRRFGGDGVGFVPLISHISGFRRSIHHHFSDDWIDIKMNKIPPQGVRLGYMGIAFACESIFPEKKDSLDAAVPVADSLEVKSIELDLADTVKITEPLVLSTEMKEEERAHYVRYVASRRFPGTNVFSTTRLFYSAPIDSFQKSGKVIIKVGEARQEKSLSGNNIVNVIKLRSTPCRQIELDFENNCSQLIYGLSFESDKGVILDNLPFRGNSGAWLNRIPVEIIQGFQQTLDIDLVVLQFGLNVLNVEMKDYSWYAAEIRRVVDHIKDGFPDVSILIAGPADRAVKIKGTMQTDPSIPLITNVLRKVSEQKKVAFFSFYEAMGGRGSMVKWVDEYTPRLANLDYTHFNFEGAEKAGGLLLRFLLEAYEESVRSGQSAVDSLQSAVHN